jgi:hypothetical protein
MSANYEQRTIRSTSNDHTTRDFPSKMYKIQNGVRVSVNTDVTNAADLLSNHISLSGLTVISVSQMPTSSTTRSITCVLQSRTSAIKSFKRRDIQSHRITHARAPPAQLNRDQMISFDPYVYAYGPVVAQATPPAPAQYIAASDTDTLAGGTQLLPPLPMFSSPEPKGPASACVFVANFSEFDSEAALTSFFEKFGPIVKVSRRFFF